MLLLLGTLPGETSLTVVTPFGGPAPFISNRKLKMKFDTIDRIAGDFLGVLIIFGIGYACLVIF
jgi:hypothetical protein